MTCGSCVARVERVISDVAGVRAARVNLTTELATVEVGAEPPERSAIIDAVRRAGYDADTYRPAGREATGMEKTHAERLRHHRLALIQAIGLGLPVLVVDWISPLLVSSQAGGTLWPLAIQALLCTVLLASSAGAPILVGGFRAIIHRSPNMDLLISMGVSAAYIAGVVSLIAASPHHAHLHAVAMILIFINLGRLLEMRARHGTTSAVAALARRLPATAQVVTAVPGGDARTTVAVPVDRLRRDDRVRVAADTFIPVDGVIEQGEAAIDASALTGESAVIHAGPGDEVRAGAIVRDGLLTIRATRVGTDSTMGRIIRAVEEAQSGRTRMQRIADRVAGVFVPIVIALAACTLIGWLVFAADHGVGHAVRAAVAVLVIACPCAMGLATPTAVLVATSTAAKHGVLVRDAGALESAGGLTHLVLDKTGTLTRGVPSVDQVFDEPVGSVTLTDRDVLRWAASAEQFAQHPLAKAIVARARDWRLELDVPDKFESKPGMGIEATFDGRTVRVGSAAYLRQGGVDLSPIEQRLRSLAGDGQSVVLVAIDGACAGVIGLSDAPREEAIRAVAAVSRLGVRVSMVTGDLATTATAIAAKLGISEVYAEQSPEGKVAIIESLRREGERGRAGARRRGGVGVGFVGDGVNDGPALAAADVGITFTSATDVAVGAADIAIHHENLDRLPYVITLARRSVRIIKQNLFWAFAYNFAAIPLAATGHVAPSVAAAAMMASSISVVLNALRLRDRDDAGSSPHRSGEQ